MWRHNRSIAVEATLLIICMCSTCFVYVPSHAAITQAVVINKDNNVFTCEGLRQVDTVTWELLEYDKRKTGLGLGVCPPPDAGNCTQPLAPLFRTHRSRESATISTLTLNGSDPKERARLQEATVVCRTPESFASQRVVESQETLDKEGDVLGQSKPAEKHELSKGAVIAISIITLLMGFAAGFVCGMKSKSAQDNTPDNLSTVIFNAPQGNAGMPPSAFSVGSTASRSPAPTS